MGRSVRSLQVGCVHWGSLSVYFHLGAHYTIQPTGTCLHFYCLHASQSTIKTKQNSCYVVSHYFYAVWTSFDNLFCWLSIKHRSTVLIHFPFSGTKDVSRRGETQFASQIRNIWSKNTNTGDSGRDTNLTLITSSVVRQFARFYLFSFLYSWQRTVNYGGRRNKKCWPDSVRPDMD